MFLNSCILFSATTTNSYENALIYLSRLIRFFQSKNVFTPYNSATVPISNPYDEMTDFKLILDLYSPSFEEQNHFWGTLGGKQYPSVLYQMRLLELKRDEVVEGAGVIEEIERRYKLLAPK